MNVLRSRLVQSGRVMRPSNPVRITPSFALISWRHQSSTPGGVVEWEDKEVDPQLGGYPQLPAVSYQRRQPYGWDDDQERRNFGEPVRIYFPVVCRCYSRHS